MSPGLNLVICYSSIRHQRAPTEKEEAMLHPAWVTLRPMVMNAAPRAERAYPLYPCTAVAEDFEILKRRPHKSKRTRRPQSKNCAKQKKEKQRMSRKRRIQGPATVNGSVTQVAVMREQIDAIDRQLSLLESIAVVSRQNAQASILCMMHKYQDIICRGFISLRPEAEFFLRSIFDPNIRTPDYTGVDVMLQQWCHLSRCHTSMHVVNVVDYQVLPIETCFSQLRQQSEDVYVVKSEGITTFRISRKTIEQLFPQILTIEPLVQHLIGKTYSLAFVFVAHVNSQNQIFQIESKVDMTAGLLDTIKDPFRTLEMLEASKFTSHGNVLVQQEVQEAQNRLENKFL